jgi:hypothetical protein
MTRPAVVALPPPVHVALGAALVRLIRAEVALAIRDLQRELREGLERDQKARRRA